MGASNAALRALIIFGENGALSKLSIVAGRSLVASSACGHAGGLAVALREAGLLPVLCCSTQWPPLAAKNMRSA